MSKTQFSIKYIAILFALVVVGCVETKGEYPLPMPVPLLTVTADPKGTPNTVISLPATLVPVSPAASNTVVQGVIAFTNISRTHLPMALITLENENIVDISENGSDSLAWSPDGQWLAFNGGIPPAQQIDIYMMKSDGSEFKRLTNSSEGKYDIDWSPDNKFLAYTYNDHVHPPDLALMNLGNKKSFLLTATAGYESHPTWSPDGRQIAYLYAEDVKSPNELRLMDIQTKTSKRLTDFPIAFGRFSWLAGADLIAFVSAESSEDCGDIYVVRSDGESLTRLTNLTGCATDVVWSPNGQYLAFVGRDKTVGNIMSWGWQIYVMDAKDHSITAVTHEKDWVIHDIDWTSAVR